MYRVVNYSLLGVSWIVTWQCKVLLWCIKKTKACVCLLHSHYMVFLLELHLSVTINCNGGSNCLLGLTFPIRTLVFLQPLQASAGSFQFLSVVSMFLFHIWTWNATQLSTAAMVQRTVLTWSKQWSPLHLAFILSQTWFSFTARLGIKFGQSEECTKLFLEALRIKELQTNNRFARKIITFENF